MFHSAKLKLTAWYLLIIMIISGMFSIAIYRLLTVELDQFAYQQRIRYERVDRDWRIPEGLKQQLLERLDPVLISDAKKRIANRLLFVNGGILIAASVASYILATRTLRPISNMLEEQKRFIADASHELRTPLTSLRSEIEVNLRNKKLTLKDAKQLLASNLEETIRLQALSDTLLKLAQNGTTTKQFKEISLGRSLETALKQLNGIFEKKQIILIKKIEDLSIFGVEDRITELFVILLDNAVKYSPENTEVIISIRKEKQYAKISVRDNGIGIKKEDLPHIFDRFYRSDESRTKTSASGFGLGLAIGKDIVNLHNGSINVKSVVNKGTEFIVKLPRSF